MNEYEKIFTTNLWNLLKSQLKGKIFCGIKDNTLKVSIKCDEIYFEEIVEDMAEKVVLCQLDSTEYAREVVGRYKKYVKEQTFKRFYY